MIASGVLVRSGGGSQCWHLLSRYIDGELFLVMVFYAEGGGTFMVQEGAHKDIHTQSLLLLLTLY